MNPEAAEAYARNRLIVTPQVAFTSVMKKADGKNRRCIIDVTLAVNGVPVATVELKNPPTAQRAADAVRQYCDDRDERDLLFAFKKRALVHFAADPDEVWMTTRLRGRETVFLPFNRGFEHGAGNPPVEGNWKTHYLWDEVLRADSLMDILQRFMHLEVKEKQVKTDKGARTIRKETMIFPRYHQLDAVRRLVAHARANGSGRNYLIQHSAGSGKSNSTAWLAHRLASLHDAQEDARAAMLRDSLQRARQPNLSFFAFTATPKFKTRVLFDESGPSGASPFHEYTMRQAIEEGFIMDVLQNYTTYKRFFGLIKQIENDPEVPRKKAAKALTRRR